MVDPTGRFVPIAEELEKRIGYQFQNLDYLRQALTHSSYANERRLNRCENNERLEYLGDAVLELIVSEFLFLKSQVMSEGEMTRLRASLVCEQALAECARGLNLGSYIFLGKGEAGTGGRDRASLISDAVEALIGAIYLDGGLTNAKEFVHKYITSLQQKPLISDSKTILQELIQSDSQKKLEYRLVSEEGPDHNKQFCVVACVNGKKLECGIGKTKKAAEQEAAYRSILRLRGILPGETPLNEE